MTVTKTYLTSSIHNRLDLPLNQASHHVESLLENLKKTLTSGEDFLISDFGKFCVKDNKTRKGRNPNTVDDLILDGRRVVTFRCSSAGSHSPENCLPACTRCNRLRWHRTGKDVRELLLLGLIAQGQINKKTQTGFKLEELRQKRLAANRRRRQ